MSYADIPQELRRLPQWVLADRNKIPLDPTSYRAASVTDPTTWADFATTVAAAGDRYDIGFVFTAGDPYVFIDLDDPAKLQKKSAAAVAHAAEVNRKIYGAFNSYAEVSRSGKGVHIICRGDVPYGARRDAVEVYGADRYAIMTGNVCRAAPIADCADMLSQLVNEIHRGQHQTAELSDHTGTLDDSALAEMACRASNGDKFKQLARGEWQQLYPSQSEADYALLNMLAYYTQDNEQVRRVFRTTALGQRGKATRNDKYLDSALRKIRSEEPPPIDFSKATFGEVPGGAAEVCSVEASKEEKPDAITQTVPAMGAVAPPGINTVPAPRQQAQDNTTTFPPGLVGAIAQYVLDSAVYPLREAALCAALGLMAGVAGRSYNVSRTGLNQYIILLAETGSGKEGAANGIDLIMHAVRTTVPSISSFKGPAVFSSGQGLLKVLQKKNCFVSVMGEFGLTLQQLSSPRANGAEVMLRRALLDLYGKSGHGRMLDEMAYSDTDKNTVPVASPTLSILGESVPSRFYEGLSYSSVEEGLVPRFLVLETTHQPTQRNKTAGWAPPQHVTKGVADLAAQCLTMANNNACQDVLADSGGQSLLDKFEAHCTAQRVNSTSGADKELWSRAYLKALRLAALVAVGCEMHRPVITQDVAAWACMLVQRTTEAVARRFADGDVGTGDIQHESEVRKAVARYVQMSKAQRYNAKCPADCIDHNVIPFAYLRDTLRRKASFRDSRMGLVRAIDTAIQDAVNAGQLLPLGGAQAAQLGINSKAWAVGRFN